MKSAKIAEVRDHLSQLLRRVEAGERILIQRHGKVIAELRPATRTSQSREEALESRLVSLEREGFLKAGSGMYPEWIEKAPAGRHASVLDALLEERENGR